MEMVKLRPSVRRRGKKIEVESFASSWKKITTRRREGVGVLEKNEESRQTFNKNLCFLLTAIMHTEILVARCKFWNA